MPCLRIISIHERFSEDKNVRSGSDLLIIAQGVSEVKCAMIGAMPSDDSFDTALAALKQARDEQAAVVAREQARLAQLEAALSALERQDGDLPAPPRQDFHRMGILEATSLLLQETGRPMSTREIADTIRARGVVTKSKNYIPTVYATLANSEQFAREGNNWVLRTP